MTKEYSGSNLLPATELNEIVRSGGLYGASSGGTDAYAITVSPVPDNLTAGDVFRFKADVGNTGACTLNVNGLGAKAIKKNVSEDLITGDILAGQLITVEYDGTNFQLLKDITGAIIASDNLILSADTERTTTNAPYEKKKEIKIITSGKYRVKFDLKGDGSSNCFGRIYKNGVAFGTEQSNGTTSYITKSEDLYFIGGDSIELWITTATTGYCRNFRIYGNLIKSSSVITD